MNHLLVLESLRAFVLTNGAQLIFAVLAIAGAWSLGKARGRAYEQNRIAKLIERKII